MYLTGSVVFWIFLIISMVLLFIPAVLIWIVTVLFDRNKKILHYYSCFWASLYTWVNPFLKVNIVGKEKLKKGETYLYCPNHSSLIDIVILYRLFRHFKWVAKKELFKVPILGWNMVLNGYLGIDRKSSSSHIRMMKNAEKYLNCGNSLMIFPEGTRSLDGNLGKFRDGAFFLSKKTSTPIVPIAIKGAREPLSDGTLIFHRIYPMTITILDPIMPDQEDSVKALNRLTKERIAEVLTQSDKEPTDKDMNEKG